MKKLLLYGAVLAALLHTPIHGTDVGKLKPVELIYAELTEDGVRLTTDTDDWGAGQTVEEAMKHLKATTAGEIYLDTADYLVVGSTELLGQLQGALKSELRICRTRDPIICKDAAEYLEIHRPHQKLGDWTGREPIECLSYRAERFELKNE